MKFNEKMTKENKNVLHLCNCTLLYVHVILIYLKKRILKKKYLLFHLKLTKEILE